MRKSIALLYGQYMLSLGERREYSIKGQVLSLSVEA